MILVVVTSLLTVIGIVSIVVSMVVDSDNPIIESPQQETHEVLFDD